MDSSQPRRFYLISFPRSGSNLLLKILDLQHQPNVMSRPSGGYFFMKTFLTGNELNVWGKPLSSWESGERMIMMDSYQVDFSTLQAFADTAIAQGKSLFIKEHGDYMASPITFERFPPDVDENEVIKAKQPWTVQMHSNNMNLSNIDEKARHQSSILNETVLPDSFLHTFLPTFIIRHPALAFPSHYRTYVDCEGIEAAKAEDSTLVTRSTLQRSRKLYDFYTEYFRKSESKMDNTGQDDANWPLILDSDDIMTSKTVLIRFCQLTGLDPDKMRFEWPPVSDEDLAKQNPKFRRYLSTLSASKGIMHGKIAGDGLNIDHEALLWRVEFGEKEAARIEGWVRAAMPDYEYLKARRLRA